MKTQFVLLPDLIPAYAISLGSLIPSPAKPQTDAYRPSSTSALETLTTDIRDFSALGSLSQNTNVSASLTKFLSVNAARGSASSTNLSSAHVRRYELTGQRDAFGRICADDGARRWLEQGLLAGEKSYLVVGYMTAVNPSITRAEASTMAYGGIVNVPVSEVVSGGADILGVLDPGVEVGTSKVGLRESSYGAEGEMAWAVGCRRLRFQMFKKREMSTAYLDKETEWKPLNGQRAGKGSEDTEEMLGVDLGEMDKGEDGLEEESAIETEEDEFYFHLEGQDTDDEDD